MTALRLKHIHRFRDRHGKVRHYFRRAGQRVPLPGLPGSEEFMAAYQAALACQPQRQPIGATRLQPGSVAALVFALDEIAKLGPCEDEFPDIGDEGLLPLDYIDFADDTP